MNGGFETGAFTPWLVKDTFPAPVIYTPTAHSGTYSAFLGDQPNGGAFEDNGDGSFYQQVVVPPSGGTLSYWYLAYTEDGIDYDWQDAYDENETPLANVIDINGADSATLVRLKGIGPVTAGKIVARRKKIPFTNINQLKETGILREATFELLKTHLCIGPVIK